MCVNENIFSSSFVQDCRITGISGVAWMFTITGMTWMTGMTKMTGIARMTGMS